MNNYEKYIAHCIEIARRGEYFVAPNPMVGAVLVGKPNPDSSEVILAEGWHERYGEGHAEVNCFKHFENSYLSALSRAVITERPLLARN